MNPSEAPDAPAISTAVGGRPRSASNASANRPESPSVTSSMVAVRFSRYWPSAEKSGRSFSSSLCGCGVETATDGDGDGVGAGRDGTA